MWGFGMSRARLGQYLLAATIGASLIPLGAVQAHVTADGSTVTRGYDNGRFHGEVKSDPPRCRRDRQVGVFKVDQGPDTLIDSDSTNADGVWVVPRPNAHGTFYAVVARKAAGSYGHSHVCRQDRSSNIEV